MAREEVMRSCFRTKPSGRDTPQINAGPTSYLVSQFKQVSKLYPTPLLPLTLLGEHLLECHVYIGQHGATLSLA